MDNETNTKKIAETAIVAGIMALLTLLGIALPFIGLLYPVGAIVSGVKSGTRYSILAVIVSTLIAATISEPIYALSIGFTLGIPGVVCAELINKRVSNTTRLMGTALVMFTTVVFSLVFLGYLTGISIPEMIKQNAQEAININKEVFGSIYKDTVKFEEALNLTADIFYKLTPALLFIVSVMIPYVNYLVSYKVLKALKKPIYRMTEFKNFKLPSHFASGSLVMLFTAYISRYLGLSEGDIVFYNIMAIVSFAFLIQGISVVVYKLDEKKTKKIVRGFVYALMILSTPILALISLVGVFDLLFDIRKLDNKN